MKKYDDGEDIDFDYLRDIAWLNFKQIEDKEPTYGKGYSVVEHTNLRNAILRNLGVIKMKITGKTSEISINNLLNQGMIIVIPSFP